jgi:hypothetical protein
MYHISSNPIQPLSPLCQDKLPNSSFRYVSFVIRPSGIEKVQTEGILGVPHIPASIYYFGYCTSRDCAICLCDCDRQRVLYLEPDDCLGIDISTFKDVFDFVATCYHCRH